MKHLPHKSTLLFSLLFAISSLFAQNAAPVAVNDTITLKAGRSYVFNPTLNDYDPDIDPFMIHSATLLNGLGFIKASYSTIEITLYYSPGTDTIRYQLKDNHNNISNYGYIIIHIDNNHTMDTININNVSAPFIPSGNAFWDFKGSASFEVPKGSGKATIFTSMPWIGGMDQNNQLHISAQMFTDIGVDYFYGPVCDTLALYTHSDSLWNRVWKISKAEIDYHKTHYWQLNYVVPEAIANWPAKGDTSLGQSPTMAPYIDKNNDGKYVPSDGDYPKIRGDQSVFIIFNESKTIHTESRGKILGFEFHETAYAFDCPTDTALNNTIFIHYDIYNRSGQNYHDVYMAIFTDFDIGYAYDDYAGCDSTRSLAYGYNANAMDGSGTGDTYGANPPAQGVVFLSDTMSACMVIGNHNLPDQAPVNFTDTGLYNLMKAVWGDGSHLTYGGIGYQGTSQTNFMFSGDPDDSTTWSEPHPLSGPAIYGRDRRTISSIGPFNLNAGAVKSIDIAYVYARDTTKSNIQNVAVLKEAVDKIRLYYAHDSIPCGGSFSTIASPDKVKNRLKIYPVPTDENLFVEYMPLSNAARFEVYNTVGQMLQSGSLSKQELHRINVESYQKGLYFILIYDGENAFSGKFIVE